MFADFLSINWDGSEVTFMTSLAGFMKMLLWDRLPDFMPERKDMSKSNCSDKKPCIIVAPRLEKEDFLHPEVPFERYLYFLAFRHPRGQTKEYLEFFDSYVKTTPSWLGDDEDNFDVLHPALVPKGPLEYPFHYNYTYVHFLPGGYLNSQTVRAADS